MAVLTHSANKIKINEKIINARSQLETSTIKEIGKKTANTKRSSLKAGSDLNVALKPS